MSARSRILAGMTYAGVCAGTVVVMLLALALLGAFAVFCLWLYLKAIGFHAAAADLPPIWLIRSASEYAVVQLIGLVVAGTLILLHRMLDDQ